MLLPFCSSLQNAEREPDLPRNAAGVTLRDVSFHSASLGRTTSYRVYLPSELPANEKLPVVYLLHGIGDDFPKWSNDTNVARYAQRGAILVMPGGGLSYYMNAVTPARDRYKDFIVKDLIADVEERFPARTDRLGRAMIGASMGGFTVVEYALSRPLLFAFAGALSPAVDAASRRFRLRSLVQRLESRRIFGPRGSRERQARDPFVLVNTANPRATPYLYMTAGDQDTMLESSQRFAERLKERGFAYEFHIMPGEHDWSKWDEQLPACFESLFKHLSTGSH
jgi:putative tributyrin esterase